MNQDHTTLQAQLDFLNGDNAEISRAIDTITAQMTQLTRNLTEHHGARAYNLLIIERAKKQLAESLIQNGQHLPDSPSTPV